MILKEIPFDLLLYSTIVCQPVMKLTILLLIFSVQKLWARPLQGFDDDVFLGHEKEFDSSLEAGIEKKLQKNPII